MRPRVLTLAVAGTVLVACGVGSTPEPTTTPAPLVPPTIEFAGLVTDISTFADHHEFTDAAGVIHAVAFDQHRDVTGNGCCGQLVVLGTDASGPFLATFQTQGGLPDDCFVENDAGMDQGSHVEIHGVLWRKARALQGAVPAGVAYPSGTRFCFDEHGRIAGIVPP